MVREKGAIQDGTAVLGCWDIQDCLGVGEKKAKEENLEWWDTQVYKAETDLTV